MPLGTGWSLAAIAVIWVAIFLHLDEQRRDAIDAARGNTASLARVYEQSLTHNLRDIEQTLFYVQELHARDGTALDLTPWVNSAELASRTVLRIRIVDRDGAVTLSDLHRPTAPIDLSDRPYFRHFADARTGPVDDRLFIGAPAPGPGPAPDPWSVEFARALMTAQGTFDGVVSVAVDPDTLIRSSQAADVGLRGMVTVTRLDGIVLARAVGTTASGAGGTPMDRTVPRVGQRSASPAVARVATEAEGGFDWRDPGDGERRIVSFRRVEGYPLLVEVALSTGEVLRGTRNDLIAVVSAGLVLSFAVGMAGLTANRRATALARTRRALGAALEHTGLGLIMMEPGGRMVVVNRRAIDLLEIPERFTAGARFAALLEWQRREGEFRHGEPAQVRPQLMTARPELTVPSSYRRMRPNGTVLDVRTHILPGGWTLRTYGDVTAAEQPRTEPQPDASPADASPADANPADANPAAVEPAAVEPAAIEPAARRPSPANHLAVEHLTATLGDHAVTGIVTGFLDGLPGRLDRMHDLALGGDAEALLREVHALAGSAATIGLDELGAAASELEQDLKGHSVTANAARLDRIDRLARSGLDRLAAYLHDRAA